MKMCLCRCLRTWTTRDSLSLTCVCMNMVVEDVRSSSAALSERREERERNGKKCTECMIFHAIGPLLMYVCIAYGTVWCASHEQGVKNGFPLKIEAEEVETREAEYNPGACNRQWCSTSALLSRQSRMYTMSCYCAHRCVSMCTLAYTYIRRE